LQPNTFDVLPQANLGHKVKKAQGKLVSKGYDIIKLA
jgi:hypothetical protein